MDHRDGLDGCGKSPPTGVSSPDRPARSESLYQMSYTCPKQTYIGLVNTITDRKSSNSQRIVNLHILQQEIPGFVKSTTLMPVLITCRPTDD
jgi:hypothetical protein